MFEIQKKVFKCSAFNQHYIFEISDEVFNIISRRKNVNGNICNLLERFFDFLDKNEIYMQKNSIQKLRIIEISIQKEKTDYTNNKLNKLPIHENLQKLNLNDVMIYFDATSLYPSAMWDENSVYPKIESVLAFKTHMNNF